MARKQRKTINDLQDLIDRINPPETINEMAQLLGYTQGKDVRHLLQIPTKEAPHGYEIKWIPKLRIKQININS